MRSPKGALSPRTHHLSNTDLFCAGFLRNFKFILLATIGIAFARLVLIPSTGPFVVPPPDNRSVTYGGDNGAFLSSSNPKAPIILPTIQEAKRRNNNERNNSKGGEVTNSPDDEFESVTLKSESADDETESISPFPDASPEDDGDTPIEPLKPTDASRDSGSSDTTEPPTVTNTTKTSSIPETSTSSNDGVLHYYNASLNPVIPGGYRGTLLQVHLVVDITSESGNVDPSSKFLLSAVERSKVLQAVGVTFVRRLPPLWTQEMHPRDPALPLLFLVDWGSMNRDCHRLQLVMEQIRQEYRTDDDNDGADDNDNNLERSNSTTMTTTTNSQVQEAYTLLVDFTGSTRQTKCDYLFQDSYSNDNNQVRLAKRSIVQGRYYNHDTNEIYLGHILSPLGWHPNEKSPILHAPLVLRESFVNAILNITLGAKVEDTDRSTDVGFFWNKGDYSHYAFYRRDMAKVVKTLHHSKISSEILMENEVNLVYTDIKGYGVANVQFAYVDRLLGCKIVVVTQRDEWEDQYRLMESLASGALVMTDDMLAMPDGLVDKVNVVVYDSPASLKKLIRYYLHPHHEEERKRIALEGYRLVMGRHRCWHRLEELIYGQPLTNAYKPYKPAPKKEERVETVYWVDVDGDISNQFL